MVYTVVGELRYQWIGTVALTRCVVFCGVQMLALAVQRGGRERCMYGSRMGKGRMRIWLEDGKGRVHIWLEDGRRERCTYGSRMGGEGKGAHMTR